MKSIYQTILAIIVVLVCLAWSCQAFAFEQGELRRDGAEDELSDEELYDLLQTLTHGNMGMPKRGSVKHLGLAGADNWRMMKNMNKLRALLSGGKRSAAEQLAALE